MFIFFVIFQILDHDDQKDNINSLHLFTFL